jgi:hypothetical protein
MVSVRLIEVHRGRPAKGMRTKAYRQAEAAGQEEAPEYLVSGGTVGESEGVA